MNWNTLNSEVGFYQVTTLEKSLGLVQQLLLGEKSSVRIKTKRYLARSQIRGLIEYPEQRIKWNSNSNMSQYHELVSTYSLFSQVQKNQLVTLKIVLIKFILIMINSIWFSNVIFFSYLYRD